VYAEADHDLVRRSVDESAAVMNALLDDKLVADVVRAADIVAAALESGGKLLIFGNGGSAADATHLAAEFVGRFLRERPAAPALSLSDNASAITAIANDYGFENVFARQVEALGRAGDVAMAISTSGRSPNVVGGLRASSARGLRTIALTGSRDSALVHEAEVGIAVPSDATPRVQEAHTLVGHLICDLVERKWT
jgi:D-sedoheptulose 7-phosphate isomerase